MSLNFSIANMVLGYIETLIIKA